MADAARPLADIEPNPEKPFARLVEGDDQHPSLSRFFKVALICSLGFGVLNFAEGVWLQSPRLLLGSAVLGLFGLVTLQAGRLARRGLFELAAGISCASIMLVTVVIAVVLPYFYLPLPFVALVGVVVALPYVSPQLTRWLAALAWGIGSGSVLLGMVLEPPLDLPEWHATGIVVGGISTCLFVTLLVILQYSGRLQRGLREQYRSERIQRFLAEAGASLAASLDYQTTLANAARLAVPFLADGCMVDVVQSDGALRRLAAVDCNTSSSPPALVDACGGIDLLEHPALPATQALLSQRTVFLPDCDDDLLQVIALNPQHLRMMRQYRIRAVLAVPLLARGRALGVLSLVRLGGRATFSEATVLVAEDLAHRAAMSMENSQLYQEAQRAVRLRDEFLSVASHELRTPLTTMRLQADGTLRLLQHEGEAPQPRVVERVLATRLQITRLEQMVSGLLDVSRIMTGHLQLAVEDVDLCAVVREVVERFAEQAQQAGTALQLRAPATVRGQWDPMRLDQLLTNLITNAIKYGGGHPVEVFIETVGAERVRFGVRDHGIGIALENQARIFGRFERAVSERNYGGLGLGLWIVRQIVEACGGRIELESSPGEGALFVVELPREPSLVARLTSSGDAAAAHCR